MTRDEIAVLDGSKCVLQLRGVRPFLSDKYDLTQHPNYKYTADFDKRYTFDIEKFLNHRMKLKASEEYDAVGNVPDRTLFRLYHHYGFLRLYADFRQHSGTHGLAEGSERQIRLQGKPGNLGLQQGHYPFHLRLSV